MSPSAGLRPLTCMLALLPAALAGAVAWNDILKQPPEWHASGEARAIADTVLLYQHAAGGWPKNRDMTVPPPARPTPPDPHDSVTDISAPTIDNDATTTQLWLLARVFSATRDERYQLPILRGLDYLLVSQYANGGWPQFHPLREGYYTRITYNDNAMVKVLEVLRDVRDAHEPFAWVDAARRKSAATAVARGLDCILRTQVKQEGRLTAWCAQHDEHTLQPAWARNFEPPTLSGMESVGLVRFLMSVEQPNPEIIAAVEGAVTWFRAVAIAGLRVDETPGADGQRDRRAVADPAAPPIWARFYELGTNRPVFTGRDKIIRYDFNEIERERRTLYVYLRDWPARLLEQDYPRWRAKHQLP